MRDDEMGLERRISRQGILVHKTLVSTSMIIRPCAAEVVGTLGKAIRMSAISLDRISEEVLRDCVA